METGPPETGLVESYTTTAAGSACPVGYVPVLRTTNTSPSAGSTGLVQLRGEPPSAPSPAAKSTTADGGTVSSGMIDASFELALSLPLVSYERTT